MILTLYIIGCILTCVICFVISKNGQDELDVESLVILTIITICSWVSLIIMGLAYITDLYKKHKHDVIISFKSNKK